MTEEKFKVYLTDNAQLMAEFDHERNAGIDISVITSGSHAKLWWKCSLGHTWPSAVSKRFLGQTCPYCSGKKAWKGYNDLSTTNPELVAEWDFERNETPIYEYRPMSNKKVWWKCEKGHSWDAVIAKRVTGEKCPICQGKQILVGFNDLATTHPSLSLEWDFEKNIDISPTSVSKGSDKSVWWKCSHNHSWKSVISSRTTGISCPQCAKELQTSFPEKVLFYYIKEAFLDAIPGYKSKELDPYELDIYIPSLHIGIEYDGERWHQNIDKDLLKNKKCSELKIALIRVREPRCPVLFDNLSINIVMSTKKSGICDAVQTIFEEISKLTNSRYIVDVDLNRDNSSILSLLDYSKKENNLLALYPNIALEWDFDKNGNLQPYNVTTGSDKKAWWICPLGHSYLSSISARVRGRGCSVCAGKTVLKGFNDFESRFPELAKDWDYQKNEITPDKVSYGSDKKFWWICDNGHSYQCSINQRRAGQSCSCCSTRKPYKEYHDILTTHPEIARQWCITLNDSDPTGVTAGSHKQVWWECSTCGHRWLSRVYNRCLNNAGCPACADRTLIPVKNDLQTWCQANGNEHLLIEWDHEKNILEPWQVTKKSEYMASWKCNKCGSTYEARVHNRANGRGCPVCSGKKVRSGINDFETWCIKNGKEYILAEWDTNNELMPSQVSHGSGKHISWICSTCGHHWSSALYSRKNNKGCPKCGLERRRKN